MLLTLGVMTFGPVVTGTALAKDADYQHRPYQINLLVVWPEQISERTTSDRVHCSGFQVH
jgi:hypothetical protein